MSRRDLLRELVASKQLTRDGKDWLTLALDPFHDYNHQIAGYPDSDGSQTVVACYEYQYNLSAPAGAAATWDAHIFNTPLAQTDSLGLATLNAGWNTVIQSAGLPAAVMGPLTIMASAAGGLLYPSGTATPTTCVGLPQGPQAADLAFGLTRIVGMGFEVHNTTADIYKQGSITAYRMPNQGQEFINTFSDNAGTFRAAYAGEMYRSPPTTPQEAMILKGTVTWAAHDGIYMVPTLSSVTHPIRNYSTQGTILTSVAAGVAGPALFGAFVETNSVPPPGVSLITPLIRKFTHFDTSGVFFSGLSNQTTLRVVLKVYVERAPTQTEPSLAVVATPSAAYDLAALELYSHAVSTLPVGAKVGENAKGDWWKSVLKVIGDVAVPIGAAMTPWMPAAPLLGAGVASGARLALGELAKRPESSLRAVAIAQGKQQNNNKDIKKPKQKETQTGKSIKKAKAKTANKGRS